jgi:tetratricopeptide (TPR) repeat protein
VRWETLGLSNTAHYADLVGHECQVEARLIERRVRLQQLWLENLERRRHRRDGLEPGQWAHYWNYARSVFDDQNQFYVRAYGLPLPARYLDERLDWLTNLRAAQRATLQLWRDDERFDAEGYHADAWEVDQAIAELSPVETGGSGDGAGILVLLFIVGAIALIIGLASNSTASTPQNTGPARATAVAMNNDGMARLKEGRCDEAVPKFEQAASADASFYEPLNNSAFCLYDQGRVDEAIAHWRKALELNLSSADTNAGLGMALYAHGNVDEGRRYYQEAMRIAPRYRDPVWLKSERLWSDRAIVDSAPLRDANGP